MRGRGSTKPFWTSTAVAQYSADCATDIASDFKSMIEHVHLKDFMMMKPRK